MLAEHPFENPLQVGELRLRLPERADVEAIVAIWDDPTFNWLIPRAYDGREPPLERITSLATGMVRYRCALLIEDQQGTLLGTIHLNGLWQETAGIGWYVAPEHRRQGVATRAVSAVMLHLLNGHNVALDAKMDHENVASRALAEKLGFAAVPCDWEGSIAFATTLGAQIDRIEASATSAPAAA